MLNPKHRQIGATLVELIMTIVVLSVGLSGIFNVLGLVAQHSADPMVLQQTVNVAEAYMSEITSKPFPAALPCPANPPVGVARSAYNDTCDYNGLVDASATGQNGVAITGLTAYRVSVSVSQQAIGLLDNSNMLQINVTVSNSNAGVSFTLNGFRANI